ncbi:MAG: hypothetical protein CMJ40_04555 [Phycisphaerae bacterium]|nr:hypothetical protein [Phycisphaerae bacterium]|tara:strand:+ start:427 stop:1371 length:945 start_codon:yes stop_codon:yes gene_type:complete
MPTLEDPPINDKDRLRKEVIRRRFWQLIAFAAAMSLVIHIGIVAYLHLVERAGRPAQSIEMVMEFPTKLAVEELTDQREFDLAEPQESSLADLEKILEPDATPPEDDPFADLMETDVGSMETLGGSGKGVGSEDGTLGGSGGAASFFGIASQGQRFAYIVDRSGSMTGPRLGQAKQELKRSLARLPDYAKFFVVFYSNEMEIPPGQTGWFRAKKSVVKKVSRWINTIPPEGGTEPAESFRMVFDLRPPPDVIFFLTDGRISGQQAMDISEMNRRSRKVVINTIAFDNNESQVLLEELARDSGGLFRFVPVRGAR